METVDITGLADEQIKALCYDIVVELGRHQRNLQALEAELERRRQAPVPKKPKRKTKDGE